MEIISQGKITVAQIKQHLQGGRDDVDRQREAGNPYRLDLDGNLVIINEIEKLIDEHAPGSLFAEAAHFREVRYKSVVPRVAPCLDPCSDPPPRETALSALVIVPDIPDPSTRPILAYQHGTMFERAHAPSLRNWMSLPATFPGLMTAAFKFAFVCGFVVVMADYHGLGSNSDHHQTFVASTPLSYSVGDLLLEVKESLGGEAAGKKPLFLAGYSQGGYVTMALSKFMQENPCYSDEFDIIASACMDGPYSVSNVMRRLVLSNNENRYGAFFPLMLRGYHSAYGDDYNGIFTREEAFKERHRVHFDLVDGHHSAAEISMQMPQPPREIFSQRVIEGLEDEQSRIFKVLRDNDPYRWKPGMKMRLYHCETDDVLPFENSEIAHREFTARDCDIPLEKVTSLPGVESAHVGALLPALDRVFHWFHSIYSS
jgi:pimeloyl-ACP methyl ester carboxylesterase